MKNLSRVDAVTVPGEKATDRDNRATTGGHPIAGPHRRGRWDLAIIVNGPGGVGISAACTDGLPRAEKGSHRGRPFPAR
jgi:hypothetical protein